MTVIELKNFIFENNKIEMILQEIGCHKIKYHTHKDYYSCANIDGDNPTAIRIKNNEYLNCDNYTRQNDILFQSDKADIISLTQYNLKIREKKYKFIDALRELHKILNLDFSIKSTDNSDSEDKIDPLYIFKKIKQTYKNDVSNLEFEVLDESVLNDFSPNIHITWFKEEGIMPWTSKKFGIGYSYSKKRNVIPLRYWATGELLGFNMRTVIENYDLFDIPKYFITPDYPKQNNLFGLYENYDTIQKAKYVVVYEAEKSVLKRDSRCDSTGVAVSGHIISDEQVRILIGLNVDIIIGFDKDICLDEIRMNCDKFYGIRPVYYIYDKYDLLKEKDSPADACNKIYEYLFKHKILYDRWEHEKYIKSLKGK